MKAYVIGRHPEGEVAVEVRREWVDYCNCVYAAVRDLEPHHGMWDVAWFGEAYVLHDYPSRPIVAQALALSTADAQFTWPPDANHPLRVFARAWAAETRELQARVLGAMSVLKGAGP